MELEKFAMEHFGITENEFKKVFVNQTFDDVRVELGGKPAPKPQPPKPAPQRQPKKKLSEIGYRADITFGRDFPRPTTTPQPQPQPSNDGVSFDVLKVRGMRGRTVLTLKSLDDISDVLVDIPSTPKTITFTKEGANMVYSNTESPTPIEIAKKYILKIQ